MDWCVCVCVCVCVCMWRWSGGEFKAASALCVAQNLISTFIIQHNLEDTGTENEVGKIPRITEDCTRC